MVYGILPLPNVKILSLVRVSQEARFATSRGKFCYVPRKQKSPLGELRFLRNITLRYEITSHSLRGHLHHLVADLQAESCLAEAVLIDLLHPMHVLWQFRNAVCHHRLRLPCRRLSQYVLDKICTEIWVRLLHTFRIRCCKGKPYFSL